jgi:hypothetical protein
VRNVAGVRGYRGLAHLPGEQLRCTLAQARRPGLPSARTTPSRSRPAAARGRDLPDHAGLPCQLVITMSLTDLERRAGRATTQHGGTLSLAEALRLAADSPHPANAKHSSPATAAAPSPAAPASPRSRRSTTPPTGPTAAAPTWTALAKSLSHPPRAIDSIGFAGHAYDHDDNAACGGLSPSVGAGGTGEQPA